jgi:type III restriction enzyme
MAANSDRQRFRNEELVLQVTTAVDPGRWQENRYEAFIDELCGYREYQKEAIRTTLRYLLAGEYHNLRHLAQANFEQNPTLEARYGSWANMQRHLQLPDQLAASLDLATGTGKSYVLYGLAAILLAEGAVDRVLVLCPSNTIEYGLLEKFRALASAADLRELLPEDARMKAPRIINATQTITEGSICVENYHAILRHVGSSIRHSLAGKGARTAVLNDEAHHVANESQSQTKRWKEFLTDSEFGFRYVVGASGTCYVGDSYFADVIYRYSLRQAMEQRFVKKVTYVAEMPKTRNGDEKWQLIRNRHEDTRRKLKQRNLRPLTIIITETINRCKDVAEELKAFLQEQGDDPDVVNEQVLTVYNNAPDVLKLPYVDSQASKIEWIVAVSMLNEGWDVKRVFQIVPHEERAFNSKLLIAQVLGRGLRVPSGWTGEQPEVTVFNHDAWAGRIRHLVNEILEIEKRLSSRVLAHSPYHFDLINIDYTLVPTTDVTTPMTGEYTLLAKGYVDLASDSAAEDISIEFERAGTGDTYRWQTQIRHKTYTPHEIAVAMYDRLHEADYPDFPDEARPQTRYTDTWTVEKLEEVVRKSLEFRGLEEATESMRQKFLQALGTLRRTETQTIRYTPKIDRYKIISTKDREADSVSIAELRQGKAVFYTELTRESLADEQSEFFDEVANPWSGLRVGPVKNRHHFKTPLNLVIADSDNERKFIQGLIDDQNAPYIDAWIKSRPMRFYEIDYAWKKGTAPKRGKFSPDFFIKVGDVILVVEIKGEEELREPSEENRKKNEYAIAHFERLNAYLEQEGSATFYKFNFISPVNFNTFFQHIREGRVKGFRSDLDVKLMPENNDR